MTTFTQQEIEYLQKHGNEVCKRIWLSLYDDRTTSVPDFREPQKVKEFLQEKYEKKRWHVPPEQAKPAAPVHASISGSSNSSTSSTPEVRPLKSLLGESAPSLHLNKNTPPNQSPVVSRGQSQQQPFHDKRFDLLSELGGDIFAAPPNMNAGASSSFANFAHFNSHTTAQSANANANFANFDAFGSTSGSSGGFTSAPQAQFQPSNTAFTVLSSSRSLGEFAPALPLQVAHNKYAVLADLDNVLLSSAKTEQGAGLAAGGGSAGVGGPPQRQPGVPAGCDRYAALAELDTVFGPSVPPTSVYNPTSTSQGRSVFGTESGMSAAQAQQALPGMAQGFGAQSTNPFVAAPAAPPTNPFQSNASFGTGSMSMPAGFGNVAAFNLPTSFSGTFQQPFPGQAPFPQPPAYPQQPNGGGFAAFGQAKPVGTPFGQTMSGPMISSNPFLGAAPSAQYPAGGSSTNPFL
ncbi:hypothetical protein JOQ06_016699 [Pogonophryne albipinna]|uniref:Arf-GAP domain-containing protein n=1 Tax=Pogonophryne albipinna TaxID=1090488 RepID=A0AAD6FIP4_9TELE|nr:hypothetical protein JOQ06_016699 [Pogonophryne albipinna]